MMNVLGNAVKYTPDGGHIRVTAGTVGERVWMEVADDGIGIPKADRSRIFERFYRVDKARSRESGGTGLGLSIATEIVQRHNGTLSLVDREGPGTPYGSSCPSAGPPTPSEKVTSAKPLKGGRPWIKRPGAGAATSSRTSPSRLSVSAVFCSPSCM
ncbi:MAG: sensor histidine kinase [Dysosmobacter welbionis]